MRDAADYVLAWPREVARAELTYLLSRRAGAAQDDGWTSRARLVLEEAFAGPAANRDLGNDMFKRPFIGWLLSHLDDLPEPEPYRPIWAARQAAVGTDGNAVLLQRAWANIVAQLRGRGYFEEVAPTPCKRKAGGEPPDAVLSRLGEAALIGPNMWPLQPGTWTEGAFYSLVELVHDHVARPRGRWKHSATARAVMPATTTCGWHYREFATEPAQALYRWHVNRVFEAYGNDLRLAGAGENLGRLERTGPADRAELIQRALASPTAAADVSHALALWRRRAVTPSDKRSAIVVLAGVLESRRPLLKQELLSKDEDALFQIANQFAIRHTNARQRSDYDEAFLDWLFWWYLATVELADRLLQRENTANLGP